MQDIYCCIIDIAFTDTEYHLSYDQLKNFNSRNNSNKTCTLFGHDKGNKVFKNGSSCYFEELRR